MTNDAHSRACLADFGFITMAFDPGNPMSSSLTLEGGTLAFMAPKLLAPPSLVSRAPFPPSRRIFTPSGWSSSKYSCCAVTSAYFPLTFHQFLTGEAPFREFKPIELAYRVVHGARPGKSANAGGIGISDSLWKLIQNIGTTIGCGDCRYRKL